MHRFAETEKRTSFADREVEIRPVRRPILPWSTLHLTCGHPAHSHFRLSEKRKQRGVLQCRYRRAVYQPRANGLRQKCRPGSYRGSEDPLRLTRCPRGLRLFSCAFRWLSVPSTLIRSRAACKSRSHRLCIVNLVHANHGSRCPCEVPRNCPFLWRIWNAT